MKARPNKKNKTVETSVDVRNTGQREGSAFHSCLIKDDLSYFEPKQVKWIFEAGEFGILIGSSSGGIRARQSLLIN